ncbi:hypothetical protein ANN_01328 [Periplaneta americana]|uniref:Uncharacterized protein n=1 Tax=Periplaneta americana TaxID=6978 RepID=A0ABQ8TT89_PERAM|nr:hypothetical protein ANN_01328 [Periplaneta americana]
MAGLYEGGNEPAGSLKAIWKILAANDPPCASGGRQKISVRERGKVSHSFLKEELNRAKDAEENIRSHAKRQALDRQSTKTGQHIRCSRTCHDDEVEVGGGHRREIRTHEQRPAREKIARSTLEWRAAERGEGQRGERVERVCARIFCLPREAEKSVEMEDSRIRTFEATSLQSKQARLVCRSWTRVCVRICVSIRRPEFECSGSQLEGPEFECSGPQLEGPEFEYSELSLKYAIKKVQNNREGLELNGLHQLLVYADNVKMLGENPETIRENMGILLEASKEIGVGLVGIVRITLDFYARGCGFDPEPGRWHLSVLKCDRLMSVDLQACKSTLVGQYSDTSATLI